jgi:hypothetical protein
MLKAYFDGSESPGQSVTLACLAGDENVWDELVAAWESVCQDRGNPPHIHMTDLMALRGIYSAWSSERRDHFVDGLLNALLGCRADLRLRAFTCSVDLAAYERWKHRNHPSPARLCARVVMPEMFDWYSQSGPRFLTPIELFFDRNEPFMRHMYGDWKSKNSGGSIPLGAWSAGSSRRRWSPPYRFRLRTWSPGAGTA